MISLIAKDYDRFAARWQTSFSLFRLASLCLTAKGPGFPGFNEWNDGMITITSYEYMLGRVNGESKMKDTWDSFWVYMNLKWKKEWIPRYFNFTVFVFYVNI